MLYTAHRSAAEGLMHGGGIGLQPIAGDAACDGAGLSRLTSQEATPMAVYSADQTGPNSHGGGVQLGFRIVCMLCQRHWLSGGFRRTC